MAINYTIYCDLALRDFAAQLDLAGKSAGSLWETWGSSDNLGPLHTEMMTDFGIDSGFACYGMTRHNKDQSAEARDYVYAFFDRLPGRRLLMKDDEFISFRPE